MKFLFIILFFGSFLLSSAATTTTAAPPDPFSLDDFYLKYGRDMHMQIVLYVDISARHHIMQSLKYEKIDQYFKDNVIPKFTSIYKAVGINKVEFVYFVSDDANFWDEVDETFHDMSQHFISNGLEVIRGLFPQFTTVVIYTMTDFESFGKAYQSSSCWNEPIAMVNIAYLPKQIALVTAHEVGHTLNMNHDAPNRGCDRSFMEAGYAGTEEVTDCNRGDFSFLLDWREEHKQAADCFTKETPVNTLCGNGLIDGDEECDCPRIGSGGENVTSCSLNDDCPCDPQTCKGLNGRECPNGYCYQMKCMSIPDQCAGLFDGFSVNMGNSYCFYAAAQLPTTDFYNCGGTLQADGSLAGAKCDGWASTRYCTTLYCAIGVGTTLKNDEHLLLSEVNAVSQLFGNCNAVKDTNGATGENVLVQVADYARCNTESICYEGKCTLFSQVPGYL